MRPSWPRSKLKLSPILASPYEHASVAMPGWYLAVHCNSSSFTPTPSIIWVASHECTSKHHKNVTRHEAHMYLHHISTTIHFILSIHLPFSWAGWLSSTLLSNTVVVL